MTQPPVTLQEFNDFLNVSDPTSAGDEERWGKIVAAAELVEQRVGAMRPREVVEALCADGSSLVLGNTPALSLTSVVPNGGTTLDLDSLYLDLDAGIVWSDFSLSWDRYVVTYVVGRDPVPLALAEATLIVGEQLWQSQRGPTAARKYTATGQDTAVSFARGFAWPNRALELIEAYRSTGFA